MSLMSSIRNNHDCVTYWCSLVGNIKPMGLKPSPRWKTKHWNLHLTRDWLLLTCDEDDDDDENDDDDDNGNDDDDDGDGDDDDSDDGEDNSDTHWLCITALSHIKSPKVARVCCQGSLVDNTINGDGDQPDDGDCGQNDDVVSWRWSQKWEGAWPCWRLSQGRRWWWPGSSAWQGRGLLIQSCPGWSLKSYQCFISSKSVWKKGFLILSCKTISHVFQQWNMLRSSCV